MFFFFNDTATTEIYTLSLHDALPISRQLHRLLEEHEARLFLLQATQAPEHRVNLHQPRSEEHTSELQSPDHLVCRLLLEKKKELTHTDHAVATVSNRVCNQPADAIAH